MQLKNVYSNDAAVQTFLSNYDFEDIAAVVLDVNSTSSWNISPPNLHRLKQYLHRNTTLHFRFKYKISKTTHEHQSDSIESSHSFYLCSDSIARYEMIEILESRNLNQGLHLLYLFPKFLKVKSCFIILF